MSTEEMLDKLLCEVNDLKIMQKSYYYRQQDRMTEVEALMTHELTKIRNILTDMIFDVAVMKKVLEGEK